MTIHVHVQLYMYVHALPPHLGTRTQVPHVQVAEDDEGQLAGKLHIEERNDIDLVLQEDKTSHG